MTRRALMIDAALAVALAILVLILAPGPATVASLALLAFILCAVTLVLDVLRNRSRRLRRQRAAQDKRRAPRMR